MFSDQSGTAEREAKDGTSRVGHVVIEASRDRGPSSGI